VSDPSQNTAGVLARPWQTTMARLAPETFARMMKFYEASTTEGRLSLKLRHLIWVAVDAVPTHFYPSGIELHARLALQHGASVAEVMEALEVAGTVGESSFRVALPILMEEIAAAGLPGVDHGPALSAKAVRIKENYVERYGHWPHWMECALRALPEFFTAMLALNHGGNGGLDDKSREIVLLAVSSCPAILDVEAIRRHTRRCLALGLAAEDLLEAVQCASGIGIHAYSIGVPEVDAALRAIREPR